MPQIKNRECEMYEHYTQHLLEASIIETNKIQPTQSVQEIQKPKL